MTVKELRTALSKLPDDAVVWIPESRNSFIMDELSMALYDTNFNAIILKSN